MIKKKSENKYTEKQKSLKYNVWMEKFLDAMREDVVNMANSTIITKVYGRMTKILEIRGYSDDRYDVQRQEIFTQMIFSVCIIAPAFIVVNTKVQEFGRSEEFIKF